MLEIIANQILFYIVLVFVLFIPGYSLLLAIFGKSKTLSALERFIISFGLSIISVDFINFSLSGLHIPITRLATLISIMLFILICLIIYKFRCHPELDSGSKKVDSGSRSGMTDEKLFNFSKNQFVLILLLLFLTIFIKTAYLTDTVFPTATDMGHHMYWTQWMIDNHQLPTYEGMPDFIIGEHVIFGAIGLASGASVFSAFPVIILLLINLLGILTVFILTLRIFKQKTIAILTLLFLGVLYAVSSPQVKFVGGGVIGNLIGNFLMPLSFYFYYRAFSAIGGSAYGGELQEDEPFELSNSRIFLALAIFSTFGLFYTHHLTSFIFLFIWVMIVLILSLTNFKNLGEIFRKLRKIIFSPQALSVFFVGLFFFFFVFTPNYIKTSAVNTAVGAPSKGTRVGLTIANLRSSIGEARLALGFLGIMILAFGFKKRNFGYTILAAWAVMIFIMSTAPHLLFVNLPSDRIGNYLSYPIAILSAYSLYFVFRPKSELEKNGSFIPNNFIKFGLAIILTFVLVDGLSDSALSFKNKTDLSPVAEAFNASNYLAKSTTTSDIILKDHNYITSDSWIKTFFMRGYTYPLSRGYFKRYEDPTKPREMCTLNMISSPDNAAGKDCFAETRTDFIMINPQFDSAQFTKLKNFNQVYSTSGINIYYKNN